MPVYSKLMKARIKLQGTELKKSGENKFAGYKYFELGDFLPQTMQIFDSLGLASVVSFSQELATLTIMDTEDGQTIAITSPMADANLKGAHPIQNLGAVESYQRRYLWMAAMEIVEHDIIDASEPPKEPPKPAPKPPAKIVGQPGEWQIKASLDPGGDVNAWLDVIESACKTALDMAQSEDDVMQLFRKNKQLFDAVKAQDASFFKTLMANFTEAKSRFSEKS
jgi:hypothetical protein